MPRIPYPTDVPDAERAILEPLLPAAKRLGRPRADLRQVRHVSGREQSCRAQVAVALSYGLLDSDEQTVFRALSVFVGGFTLEAAEAITDEGNRALPRILEQVQSLVDKSLVRAATAAMAGKQAARFHILETIREFGLEQLSASGEFDVVQERHARFYRALVGPEGGWLPHGALAGPTRGRP